MQNSRSHILPSWFSRLLVVLFALHFSLVLLHQFGKNTIPQPAKHWVDNYILPWFYQNYYMFAPDPATSIHTFLYRVKTGEGWSTWKNPVYPYQQQHWSNRFGYGSDMYDVINGIADALFNGAQHIGFRDDPPPEAWFDLPGYVVAERYVRLKSPFAHTGIEELQVGVYTEHHSVDSGGRLRQYILFQPFPVKDLRP